MDLDYDTDTDTDTDTESNYSDNISDIEHILGEENEFIDSNKENGKYYIGLCKHFHSQNCFIMAIAMTPKMFLKTDYETALEYLYSYSIMQIHQPTVDIMKLEILNDNTYVVIKKTYWIRLIQRTWKRVIKEREMNIRKRFLSSFWDIQITGKYKQGSPRIQGLRGLLNHYLSVKSK